MRSINLEAFGVLIRFITYGIKADLHVSSLSHEKSYLEQSVNCLKKNWKMTYYSIVEVIAERATWSKMQTVLI